MHRHKLHDRPVGWGAMGPIECRRMLEAIKPMVHAEPGLTKKLSSQMPHSTWDNHFSDDNIMDYAGEHGFGLTMTCRRDRLPKDVPSTYWHKERTDSRQGQFTGDGCTDVQIMMTQSMTHKPTVDGCR